MLGTRRGRVGYVGDEDENHKREHIGKSFLETTRFWEVVQEVEVTLFQRVQHGGEVRDGHKLVCKF